MTALLVALLSVPVGLASATADDGSVSDPAATTSVDAGSTDSSSQEPAAEEPVAEEPAAEEPAAEEPAAEEPAAEEPAAEAPAEEPAAEELASEAPAQEPASSPQRTSEPASLADSPTAIAGVCDTNDGAGKVTDFDQNTRQDESGEWINGIVNANKGPLHEGEFVPQRLTLGDMPLGENEIVIESKLLEGDLHAYDFIPAPGDATYPGFTPTMTGGTITNWDVTIGPIQNGDQWATIKITIDVTTAGEVILKWYPHIASELDWGPGTGAGSINGGPYHNKLVSLNCDASGSKDNQIMAGAIHYSTINVVKDAQPDSPDDFHFSITPGGNASTFDLDDDSDPTLPNTLPVPFRVAPTTTYTITETNIPAGWQLTAINCVNTLNNTTTVDLATNSVQVHTSDTLNQSLQGTTTCTFVNSRESSVTVNKLWNVNGTTYANGEQPALYELSAQLKIDDTNQAWGVARTGFLAGDSATIDETTTIGNSLCTLTGSTVSSHGDAALPFNTGPLAGGSNTYTITNAVTCVANVTLVKVVDNGPAVASAWTLNANDGGAGPDLSGPTGTSGSITADTDYTLSESGGDARYDQVGPWVCTDGVTVTNGVINVDPGVSTTCTVHNATAKLTLVKHVINNSGGTALAGDFTLSFSPAGGSPSTSGPGSETGTSYWVNPGTTYTVSESGPANYTQTSLVCGDQATNQATPAAGQEVVCTFTNDDDQPHLTLVKVLDNGDSGSPYDLEDFTLSAQGPTPISGTSGMPEVTSVPVDAGAYALSESGPDGYNASAWTCVGGTQDGASVTIGLGQNVTCQITNTAIAPKLTLIKNVVNPDGSGGTAVATDWTLFAAGPVDISGPGGVGATEVEVGTYTLTESAGPTGYSASTWSCSGGSLTGNEVSLELGDVAVCQITNTAQQGSLTLNKHVDHGTTGDTTPATAWTLTADGTSADLSGDGTASGNVPAGTYALSESGPTTGWTASAWTCVGGTQNGSNITVGLGQDVVCDITNTAVKPMLTLDKIVDSGDTGDTTEKTAWLLSATSGENVVSGQGHASSSTPIGTYALAESGPTDGWTASAWTCVGGSQSGSSITLALGDDVTCTITNTAEPAHLTLVKVVDHNGTGDLTPATAWTLKADGASEDLTGPGGASSAMPIGGYDLSETGPDTYSQGAWSCTDGQDGAHVTLALGDDITCTITNTAIPSAFEIVKTAEVVGKSYADPAHAEPGDTIRYTITATKVGDGVDVFDVDVMDDLSDVLDDADLTAGPSASNGTAVLDGTTINWHIEQISTFVTMTYDVLVDADAFDRTLRNVVTSPESNNCPEGSVDPDCTTTHLTPHWLLEKSSDQPVNVMPGDTITYTLTVTNDSDTDVLHAVVHDKLDTILEHASLNLPLAAGLVETATGLTWTVPTPLAPDASVQVSYSVTVNEGAWDVDLDNLATPGEPGGNCPTPADCTTHHETPPVKTFVVKKVDFETGDALAGAKFVLWLDNGTTVGVKDAGDTSLGEQTTDADGKARWGDLLAGDYLVEETVAPPGYALPAVTVFAFTLDMARDYEANPFIVQDPSVGNLGIVAKRQYERNANGVWVLSDGIIGYGERVKYIVSISATGTKLFHNVKVTDYVPGYNPTDTHVFGTGSTTKATLVPGSARCTGTLDCTVTVSASQLVTWSMGTVKNVAGDIEMVVVFPDAPDPVPFDASGNFQNSLWNVGFLDYDTAVSDLPGSRTVAPSLSGRTSPTSRTAALELQHTHLKSNEVIIKANLRKPPPGVVPCKVHCLPNTGSPNHLLQLGLLGSLALLTGTALVARNRRRTATT